jgi:hypothetical protein
VEDRISSSPADSETVEELVPQTLTLSNSGKTAVLNFLSVHLERVLGEVESLLDKSGKFTDSAALLAQDLLGVGSADDNLVESYTFKPPNDLSTQHIPQCGHG